ncbi:MAG TPA: AMP-binding protein [Iamia sp.]|nr:AMP-binding protein [Iamia sp.]
MSATTEWKVPGPRQVFGDELVDRYLAEGAWEGATIARFLADWADASPDDDAVIDDGGRRLSAGELRDQAWRLASGLARRGVRPGDRVLAQISNRVEAVVAFYGIVRLGAVVIPAQAALRRHDVESLANRTGAVLAITVDEYRRFGHREMFEEALPSMPTVRELVVIGEPGGATPWAELLAAAPYDGPYAEADDPAVVMFTSGTTAQPKGCVHTSNTLMVTSRGTGRAMGIGPDDVMFMPSPVMHTTGIAVGILSSVLNRIPCVLQSVWEPRRALENISEHGCTMTIGATTFATMMLAAYDPAVHDITSFRYFGLAGAPIPAEVVRRLQDTFGCRVGALYGSTEGLIISATRLDDPIERIATSDGVAAPGVSLEVVDPAGEPLPPGEEGEIAVRTPGRFLCYWDDDERTADALDERGRLRTGDLGRMDADGYVRITGRMADLIIRGGMNISAAEVEGLLLEHPQVSDVALVAMPDERLGERACAFVVSTSRSGPTVADLAALLAERGVATFKFPERVEVVDELPRNPTGKVEKFKLRQQIRDLIASGA